MLIVIIQNDINFNNFKDLKYYCDSEDYQCNQSKYRFEEMKKVIFLCSRNASGGFSLSLSLSLSLPIQSVAARG